MDPDIRVFKDTSEGELRVHIFAHELVPASCGIVYYCCGGWNGFDATSRYPQCEYFASRGAVAMVAEVRVIPKHGTTPAECVTDAKSSIRWVRQHASELRIPTDRIVAAGGSAAGHVSLATVMIDGFEEPGEDHDVSSAPDLVIAYNPAVLPELNEKTRATERVQQRIEKFGGEDKIRALSPMLAVGPGIVPILIMHGDADQVTPYADSAAFAEAMAAAGNECRLKTYPGEGHGFFNWRTEGNPRFTDTLRDADLFLVEHGFLSGVPTV